MTIYERHRAGWKVMWLPCPHNRTLLSCTVSDENTDRTGKLAVVHRVLNAQLLDLVVSRVGLEPRALALKAQIGRFW